MSKAKSDLYSDTIDENKDKPKELHQNKSSNLPDCTSVKKLANCLGDYFKDKISHIMSTFSSTTPVLVLPNKPACFSCFSKVSVVEVHKLLLSSPNKQCGLDPVLLFWSRAVLIF